MAIRVLAGLLAVLTAACGTSKCLKLKIDTLPNWKRYRYRVFDTVIPLRNMLWNS